MQPCTNLATVKELNCTIGPFPPTALLVSVQCRAAVMQSAWKGGGGSGTIMMKRSKLSVITEPSADVRLGAGAGLMRPLNQIGNPRGPPPPGVIPYTFLVCAL